MNILTCGMTLVLGFGVHFTNSDGLALQRGREVCKKIRKTPCLKSITKIGTTRYAIECGGKK